MRSKNATLCYAAHQNELSLFQTETRGLRSPTRRKTAPLDSTFTRLTSFAKRSTKSWTEDLVGGSSHGASFINLYRPLTCSYTVVRFRSKNTGTLFLTTTVCKRQRNYLRCCSSFFTFFIISLLKSFLMKKFSLAKVRTGIQHLSAESAST